MTKLFSFPKYACRRVQPFGISGPQWKKKGCLGLHIKYIVTSDHKKKSQNILSKFTILYWATFIAFLGSMWPMGHGLDTPALEIQDSRETGEYHSCL